MIWKRTDGNSFQSFLLFCPAPAPKLPRKPHDPSERAEREMLSPWDLQVQGSFPDLVTQFPREREGRVYSCQRRSPNGGESLRLRPTDLSPTAGQGRGWRVFPGRLAWCALDSREPRRGDPASSPAPLAVCYANCCRVSWLGPLVTSGSSHPPTKNRVPRPKGLFV